MIKDSFPADSLKYTLNIEGRKIGRECLVERKVQKERETSTGKRLLKRERFNFFLILF